MDGTRRIIERLPSFYGAWNADSLLYKLIDAFGMRLDEAEKDLVASMKSHWVDTASSDDLRQLAALYVLTRRTGEDDDDFRKRVKAALLEYKGGGTVAAILSLTSAYLGAKEGEIELTDNPLLPVTVERHIRSGDTWAMSSNGVDDSVPEIRVFVEPVNMYFDAAKFDDSPLPLDVTSPVITNLDTRQSVGFKGIVQGGQELVISGGKAELDGSSATSSLTSKAVPMVTRKESHWKYSESLEETIGTFDKGTFNSSMFEINVAAVRLTFSWVARQLSTFELKVRNEALIRSGLSLDDVKGFLGRVKALGVEAVVTVAE
jgi:hypothetical protein